MLVCDKTKANSNRLGSDGPRLIDLIPNKIVLVDCRNVTGLAGAFVEHSCSLAMSPDLGEVLRGVEPEFIDNRAFVAAARSLRILAEPET